MASLLSTSVTPTSFGPLVSNESAQRLNEGNLLEAATRLLADHPPPRSGKKHTKLEAAELRMEVVQFLGSVAGVQMGVAALARHPTALPRLARRIADELEEVYEWRFGAERRYVIYFSLTFLYLPRSGQADGGFLFLPLLLAPISRVGARSMGTSRRNSRRNQLQERKERRLRSLRTAINLPKNKKECEKKSTRARKTKKTKKK